MSMFIQPCASKHAIGIKTYHHPESVKYVNKHSLLFLNWCYNVLPCAGHCSGAQNSENISYGSSSVIDFIFYFIHFFSMSTLTIEMKTQRFLFTETYCLANFKCKSKLHLQLHFPMSYNPVI